MQKQQESCLQVGGTRQCASPHPTTTVTCSPMDGLCCAVQVDKRNRKAQGQSPVLPACLPAYGVVN
jgi:hypothetical protein